MTNGILKPVRAILSVYDKTGIVDFAKALHGHGVELLSSGGTAKAISDAGIPVIEVGDYTGAQEMFSGRVKTLHPKIHGGILARRPFDSNTGEFPDDTPEMEKHNIPKIDIVCCNLYPFQDTVAKPDTTLPEALENIDIGGPAMIRAAAKNYPSVCVITNPAQYQKIIDAMNESDGIPLIMRKDFARVAFHHTAMYDVAISAYFRCLIPDDSDPDRITDKIFPDFLPVGLRKIKENRYGENPHQRGAYYRIEGERADFLSDSEILQGKEISYNNLLDIDSVVRICREFPNRICATVVKHQSPTGVAIAETAEIAYRNARAVDELASFGNVTGISGIVDEAAALAIKEAFVEVVVAVDFTPEALEILRKKKNLRLVKTDLILPMDISGRLEARSLSHGVLIQEIDTKIWDDENFRIASERQPSDDELKAMDIGWRVVKHVRSNATVLANSTQTLGTGPGQTSRIATFEIAILKAGDKASGAVAATDGFCFPDSVEVSHAAGVTAIIEPGGSRSDKDTIAKADELGLALVLTGMRHFRH